MRRTVRWLTLVVAASLLGACSSSSGTSTGASTSGSAGAASTTGAAVGSVTSATPTTPATSAASGAASGAQWTTYYRDAARGGLAPDGPSSPAVRQLWTSPTLDGEVYAQPLLVGDHVVTATENDSVYSLNATNGMIEWTTHLGEPVPGSSLPCGNVDPVGITGTPVIDVNANRVYVVGMVQPGQHMLFSLDLSTGALIASTHVDAEGADPSVHNQRGALALANGNVFVPYGGRFGDCGDYHGSVVAVAVSSAALGTVASYVLPTQGRGGFWAPPGVLVAADGSLYLTSGNSTSSKSYDYGNSVVRVGADLQLADSFAPSDWASLNATDTDLGSTGPVLLPNGRVFQVGKSGTGYLLDAEHLGGVGGQLHSGKVCQSSAFGAIAHDGDTMFVPCSNGVVQVTVNGDSFDIGWTAPVSTPGPTIIAAGAVWTVATGSGDLVGLDASSGTTISSNHIGNVPSRFTSPAAGGGRVVVAATRTLIAFGA